MESNIQNTLNAGETSEPGEWWTPILRKMVVINVFEGNFLANFWTTYNLGQKSLGHQV